MSVVPVLPIGDEFGNVPDDFKTMPPVDTEGGTIVKTDYSTQVDPFDGCTVQIATYHIISADGQEEMVKTQRRKIRMNVKINVEGQTTHRDGNNKASTVVDRMQHTSILSGDGLGFRSALTGSGTDAFGSGNLYSISGGGNAITDGVVALNSDSQQDERIREVLQQTQETFARMLNDKKSEFKKMFPDLFKNMRGEQGLAPLGGESQTVTNPDGSTTTIMSSRREMRSMFRKQETYINGVIQESKVKTRAFMEYKGPEGGFVVRLADGDENEASEDEADDEMDKVSQSASEFPDDTRSTILIGGGENVPKLDTKGKAKNRNEKAWYAAKELVESEQRYVEKLRLLDETFRERLEKENQKSNIMEQTKIGKIFSNVHSIYKFHNDHLLPQLMDRLREWNSSHKISDVMKKQAPFLKMYSEYTNNYKRATTEFEKSLEKNAKFRQIVKEIENSPECENLPLMSHLICPVQRVMRYQLLLQEYLKNLSHDDPDFMDTEEALKLVLDAASHANEIMRKLDRYRNVLEVQELLGNQVTLVSPGRELIKKGKIMKTSSKTGKSEERYLFLFNDMLLLCSSRKLAAGKFRIRAIFDATFMQVCEGDNLEREHSFYVRGSDSKDGQPRCVEMFGGDQMTKKEWMDALWTVISDATVRRGSFDTIRNTPSPSQSPDREPPASARLSQSPSDSCSQCGKSFGWISKSSKTKCDLCGTVLCKKCLHKIGSQLKVCEKCNTSGNEAKNRQSAVSAPNTPRTNVTAKKRFNALQVMPTGEGVIYNGPVELRSSQTKQFTKRFFVLRVDFCLYSFRTEHDKCAQTMLPMPGCEVKSEGGADGHNFRIKHMNRNYCIRVADTEAQAKWMAALELAANAAIADQEGES